MRWNWKKKGLFDEKTGRALVQCTIECKSQVHNVVEQLWLSWVEKFDVGNAIQTKAQFSFLIAVSDRIGGCEEDEGEQENWIPHERNYAQWAKPHSKLEDF